GHIVFSSQKLLFPVSYGLPLLWSSGCFGAVAGEARSHEVVESATPSPTYGQHVVARKIAYSFPAILTHPAVASQNCLAKLSPGATRGTTLPMLRKLGLSRRSGFDLCLLLEGS